MYKIKKFEVYIFVDIYINGFCIIICLCIHEQSHTIAHHKDLQMDSQTVIKRVPLSPCSCTKINTCTPKFNIVFVNYVFFYSSSACTYMYCSISYCFGEQNTVLSELVMVFHGY